LSRPLTRDMISDRFLRVKTSAMVKPAASAWPCAPTLLSSRTVPQNRMSGTAACCPPATGGPALNF
jgi:hypothetical protein